MYDHENDLNSISKVIYKVVHEIIQQVDLHDLATV